MLFRSETFFPTLEENDVKRVYILGDTFDRRKYVNFYSLKRTKEMFFDPLYDGGYEVMMLAGNHDTYFKNTNEVNSIRLLLQEYPNITVIDKPETDNGICLIPWMCAENFEDCIREMERTTADICCGHFEIAGFAMYRGMHSEGGLDPNIFRKFDYTFSGHYHHKSDKNGIYYLGNPYELTWQDYNDPRGFHLFDIKKRELQFIENPNRMFHRVFYDDKKESILEITGKDLSSYASKYVKVVVTNKTNPFLFDQFMNKLYNENPIDITIVEDAIDLTESLEDDMINEAEDTVTIINKYVDALEQEGIDNNKLKDLMRELYVEALNIDQA